MAETRRVLSLDVSLSWPDFDLAVRHDFRLEGVTGLFGPSGSGKSTLLRIICGIEKRATGVIRMAGATWQDSDERRFVAAHERTAGYVFQDARLFTHLTVAGNLEYASARVRPGTGTVPSAEIIAAFDIGPLLHRRVQALSGGERQRVAIARTLMSDPSLLLLDEPLAALDARRKAEILPYLEALPRRFELPVIYVSHAIDEVARLAEQVVVLDHGRVAAHGSAARILSRDAGIASGLPFDAATVLEAHVTEHLDDMKLTRLALAGQSLVVPQRPGARVGDSVRLYVRAGDVALATREPSHLSFRNILSGSLTALESHPDSAFASASIDIGDAELRVHLTRQAVLELGLVTGMPVYALLKTASFDDRAPPA